MAYSIRVADGAVLPPRFATPQDAFVYLTLAAALWAKPDVELWLLVDDGSPSDEALLGPGAFAQAARAWLKQRAMARAAPPGSSRPRRAPRRQHKENAAPALDSPSPAL